MTAGTAHLAPARSPLAAGWLVPVELVAGLAAIVGVRWLATRGGTDPLLVGLAFGLAPPCSRAWPVACGAGLPWTTFAFA